MTTYDSDFTDDATYNNSGSMPENNNSSMPEDNNSSSPIDTSKIKDGFDKFKTFCKEKWWVILIIVIAIVVFCFLVWLIVKKYRAHKGYTPVPEEKGGFGVI